LVAAGLLAPLGTLVLFALTGTIRPIDNITLDDVSTTSR
jgi:hypothetical protein